MAAKSLGALMLLAAVSSTMANAREEKRRDRPLSANPSAFIAADISLSHLTREKGVTPALRDMAHKEAWLLTPTLQAAEGALKAKKDAAAPIRWQAHRVAISCDGNMGLTEGRWSQGEAAGRYLHLWQRDERGRMKWRYRGQYRDDDLGDAPDYIASKQAVCRPAAPKADAGANDAAIVGRSADRSMSWSVNRTADGIATLSVSLWNGTEMASPFGATSELVTP